MAKFKAVATQQLTLLFFVFLLGSSFRALPGNPATSACGSDLYPRLVFAHDFLALFVVTAAMLFLTVRMAVRAIEAGAVAAARAAAADGDKAFDADREAAAAAVEGLGSVPDRRSRVCLRAMLLLGVALSAAASVLAVVAIQDGFRYRIGCDPDFAWYGVGRGMAAVLLCLLAAVHGFSAWVAVSQN